MYLSEQSAHYDQLGNITKNGSFPARNNKEPHFEKTSFRVHKKIFASYDNTLKRACLKLSDIDQDVFSAFDRSIIFRVPNKWGKQGWTFIDMKRVKKEVLSEVIKTAYCEVAPKKLSLLVKEIL